MSSNRYAAFCLSEIQDAKTFFMTLDQCLNIRKAVFQEEQGIRYDLDRDGFDYDTRSVHHIAVAHRARPTIIVGTVRMRLLRDRLTVKLERMAVAAAYRRRGAGKALLIAFEQEAERRGRRKIILNATQGARGFFARYGYTVVGGEIVEAKIVHYPMQKLLLS